MDKLLNLLDKNCRMTNEQLAIMLGVPTEDVEKAKKSLKEWVSIV